METEVAIGLRYETIGHARCRVPPVLISYYLNELVSHRDIYQSQITLEHAQYADYERDRVDVVCN